MCRIGRLRPGPWACGRPMSPWPSHPHHAKSRSVRTTAAGCRPDPSSGCRGDQCRACERSCRGEKTSVACAVVEVRGEGLPQVPGHANVAGIGSPGLQTPVPDAPAKMPVAGSPGRRGQTRGWAQDSRARSCSGCPPRMRQTIRRRWVKNMSRTFENARPQKPSAQTDFYQTHLRPEPEIHEVYGIP